MGLKECVVESMGHRECVVKNMGHRLCVVRRECVVKNVGHGECVARSMGHGVHLVAYHKHKHNLWYSMEYIWLQFTSTSTTCGLPTTWTDSDYSMRRVREDRSAFETKTYVKTKKGGRKYGI